MLLDLGGGGGGGGGGGIKRPRIFYPPLSSYRHLYILQNVIIAHWWSETTESNQCFVLKYQHLMPQSLEYDYSLLRNLRSYKTLTMDSERIILRSSRDSTKCLRAFTNTSLT